MSKAWRAVLCLALVSPVLIFLLATTVKGKVAEGVSPNPSSRDVWVTMSRSLPDVSNPGMLTLLFWGSAAIFLAGFIVAVWYSLEPVSPGRAAVDDDLQANYKA